MAAPNTRGKEKEGKGKKERSTAQSRPYGVVLDVRGVHACVRACVPFHHHPSHLILIYARTRHRAGPSSPTRNRDWRPSLLSGSPITGGGQGTVCWFQFGRDPSGAKFPTSRGCLKLRLRQRRPSSPRSVALRLGAPPPISSLHCTAREPKKIV